MSSCEIPTGKINENNNQSFWLPLEEMKQLDAIKEASKTKTQVIFKNSTRCGICKQEKKEIEEGYVYNGKVATYLLDLLNYRPISLAIAEKFGVTHQSPQLLIIKNGAVVHHASQHDIDVKAIANYI